MIVVGLLLPLCAHLAQDPGTVPTPGQLELEVLANVKGQPLGDGTVADLALPEEFLRRVADRVVRASFEERYRIVVRDPVKTPAKAETAPAPARPTPILLAVAALLAAGAAWIVLARRNRRREKASA